jgi:hypothetical protein
MRTGVSCMLIAFLGVIEVEGAAVTLTSYSFPWALSGLRALLPFDLLDSSPGEPERFERPLG